MFMLCMLFRLLFTGLVKKNLNRNLNANMVVGKSLLTEI